MIIIITQKRRLQLTKMQHIRINLIFNPLQMVMYFQVSENSLCLKTSLVCVEKKPCLHSKEALFVK